MSISVSVSSVGRASPQPGQTPAAGPATLAVRAGSGVPQVEIDAVTNLPKPPRFPWLSRLSAQLEPSAKQKPPFPSAPPLGEHLDRAA